MGDPATELVKVAQRGARRSDRDVHARPSLPERSAARQHRRSGPASGHGAGADGQESWVTRFRVQGSRFKVRRGESMRVRTAGVCAAVCVWAISSVPAQEREDRTLLTQRADARDHQRGLGRAGDAPRAGAGAVSARAAGHREYQGHFRESEVMAQLREGVRLQQRRDRDVSAGRADLAGRRVGELWMTTPESREAVRHPRRRARARPGDAERRRLRRPGRRRRRAGRRTSRARI